MKPKSADPVTVLQKSSSSNLIFQNSSTDQQGVYPTAGPVRPTPAAQPYTVLLRMAGKNGEGTLWDSNSYEVFDSNLRRPLLR